MSQLKSVKCPNCGAQLVGQANKYYCAYCNSIVETDNYDKVIKIEKVITANITNTNIYRDEAELEKLKQKKRANKILLIALPTATVAFIVAFKFFPYYATMALLISAGLFAAIMMIRG